MGNKQWLSGEELEQKDESLVIYLHGLCHEWALNNCKNNDKFIVFAEYDEEIVSECLMHCCLLRDGSFVDVRGVTDDIIDVINDFDYGDYDELLFETKNDFEQYLKEINVI